MYVSLVNENVASQTIQTYLANYFFSTVHIDAYYSIPYIVYHDFTLTRSVGFEAGSTRALNML